MNTVVCLAKRGSPDVAMSPPWLPKPLDRGVLRSTDDPWHLDWLRWVLTPTGVGWVPLRARTSVAPGGSSSAADSAMRGTPRPGQGPYDAKPLGCAPPPFQMQGGRWSNNPTPRHLEVDLVAHGCATLDGWQGMPSPG